MYNQDDDIKQQCGGCAHNYSMFSKILHYLANSYYTLHKLLILIGIFLLEET